jgi:hypothetical protein
MRAGMKLVHIDYHANQLRRMPASSILVGLLCLSGVFWLSIAPIFFATRCGLLLPHDHLLLKGASENDLETHLSAEAACAAGGAPLDVAHSHPGAESIISVSHFEPESTSPGSILTLDQLTLVIPALLAGGGLLPLFVWRLPFPWVAERSYSPPPGDPPPESGLLLAG